MFLKIYNVIENLLARFSLFVNDHKHNIPIDLDTKNEDLRKKLASSKVVQSQVNKNFNNGRLVFFELT